MQSRGREGAVHAPHDLQDVVARSGSLVEVHLSLSAFKKAEERWLPRFVYGPEVDGAHSTFLQFALDKLRQGLEFKAFADQTLRALAGAARMLLGA